MLRSVLVFIFVISEMCTPLGMGELGTQPLEVSETFHTPQCFKPLLAQGMIMLSCSGVQLELLDFCVNSVDFVVIVSEVVKLHHDSPVFKAVGMLKHNKGLRIWSSEYCVEPVG
jgi:hypothetical protein